MKKYCILSVVLLFTGITAYAQVVKDITAEIRRVTVFPDRAQIDHETGITIPPGQTTFRLAALSPYIDPQSVQVKGTGSFTILSVNHQNNYLQNLEDTQEAKSLQGQIEALRLKVEDENTAIGVLKEKEAFLTVNKSVAVKESAISAEQLRAHMDLYTSSMEQVRVNILKKERVVKEYEKQIAALEQQLASKTGKNELPSGEVTILLSADAQVNGKLSISYVAANAGWYPSYDIRVDDIKNPVAISYKANVFQSTGTPWKNVRLSFSNATPWISGTLPLLNPWFVDFYTPPAPAPRSRSMRKEMEEPAAPEALNEVVIVGYAARDAAGPEVQKTVGETTVTFDVNVPYTVQSDGKMQTVEIQRLSAPADYKYVTMPKKSALAYLTANIRDWAELSLQSGEATLYFENSFVGKSFIDVSQTTDTLSVSLGADNSIIVKREKRKDFTSRKVLGSNKSESYSFLITVRNNKKNPVKITVKDQIPVSSNSSIEISATELSGGRLEAQTGIVTWDLEIKPGETRELTLGYSVKYPKDRTIILE